MPGKGFQIARHPHLRHQGPRGPVAGLASSPGTVTPVCPRRFVQVKSDRRAGVRIPAPLLPSGAATPLPHPTQGAMCRRGCAGEVSTRGGGAPGVGKRGRPSCCRSMFPTSPGYTPPPSNVRKAGACFGHQRTCRKSHGCPRISPGMPQCHF